VRTITITLGGEEYEIVQLPISKSREWRKKLAGPFSDLVSGMKTAKEVELSDLAGIAGLVELVQRYLLEAPDEILALLYAYAPNVAAKAEQIEEAAYDEEVFTAFVQVVKLAYPFGELKSLMGGR
jgi:hypothetical protein